MSKLLAMIGMLLALLVAAAPHGHAHVGDGAHETADHDHHESQHHNPSDHSHPLGEDPLHDLLFHGGADSAGFASGELAPPTGGARFAPADFVAALHGISIPPPVPPPLR
jgi:hypothetical protein